MFIYVVETEDGQRMDGINASGKRVSAKKATSFFGDIIRSIRGQNKVYPTELTICYEGKTIRYRLEERKNGSKSPTDP